jgi:hypothetical protein
MDGGSAGPEPLQGGPRSFQVPCQAPCLRLPRAHGLTSSSPESEWRNRLRNLMGCRVCLRRQGLAITTGALTLPSLTPATDGTDGRTCPL